MEVRGERKCAACGTRWSYYETGSVSCPECGSLRSVGVDERTRHTATPVDLDLSAHRMTVDEEDLSAVVADLKSDLRSYVRRRGFIDAGDLLDLDDTYLAASELLQAVDAYERTSRSRSAEGGSAGAEAGGPNEARLYVLTLLRGADAEERPAPEAVPASLREARGLAYADAILSYRGEVIQWLDDGSGPGRQTLVRATRETVAYLRDDDEGALATAEDRLDRLG